MSTIDLNSPEKTTPKTTPKTNTVRFRIVTVTWGLCMLVLAALLIASGQGVRFNWDIVLIVFTGSLGIFLLLCALWPRKKPPVATSNYSVPIAPGFVSPPITNSEVRADPLPRNIPPSNAETAPEAADPTEDLPTAADTP